MMPSLTGPHPPSTLGTRTTRLSLLGGTLLGAVLALGTLATSWQEPAMAAAAPPGLSDKVLEGVLLDHMDAEDAERALRYLARFHPDESVRQWAQQELAVDAPVTPPTVWTPLAIAASEIAEPEPDEVADAPTPTVAAPPPPAPKPVAKAQPKPASEPPPRKERARHGTPVAKKARTFEAAKFLPRADMLPHEEDEAQVAAEPAPPPPTAAPEVPEAPASDGPREPTARDAGTDAPEPAQAPPPKAVPSPPPPEPEPEPAPTPVPVLSVDGLSLSDRFLSSEEVVLALAGLEERARRCWSSALTANPDPELGGEVTIRFRLHNGRPALVKAVHDDSGSDSFVPCVNRLLRQAEYGEEARGVVEWTLLVDNGA